MTDINSPFGEVVAAAGRTVTEIRTGTVTAVSTTTLSVNVSGTTMDVAYLASYSALVGDLAAIGRWGETWLAFGRLAGVGPNLILNPSFEQDGLFQGVPTSWNFAILSGAPSVSTLRTGAAIDGLYEAVVAADAAAQDSYLYSNPVAVVPGETWAASAYAASTYPVGAPQNSTASLYALWFATDTDLYPTTSSADTLIGQVTNLSAAPIHESVSGQVVVPAGANYVRVALRSVTVGNLSMWWDLVTIRKIG